METKHHFSHNGTHSGSRYSLAGGSEVLAQTLSNKLDILCSLSTDAGRYRRDNTVYIIKYVRILWTTLMTLHKKKKLKRAYVCFVAITTSLQKTTYHPSRTSTSESRFGGGENENAYLFFCFLSRYRFYGFHCAWYHVTHIRHYMWCIFSTG